MGQGVTVRAEARIDLAEPRRVEVHDGVQPRSVTAEGLMERYLVDRLLVGRERYDSVR